jgi:ABC-type nickel/cobalt efflux system permease component RcnA
MIAVLSLILLGFFLGMRHATDPDHVIAVSTIVTRQPTIGEALMIGSLWGVGHTLTIVAVGGALVVFTIVIPPRLGLSMEMAVALMLIALGMWNLTGVIDHLRGLGASAGGGAGSFHGRLHCHGDYVHTHPSGAGLERHEHRDDEAPLGWLDRQLGGLGVYQLLRPLAVGLVHGLAGSAAVALLVLSLIKNPWWAMAYLVLFGIGTIVGMMLITAVIGAMFAYASRRSLRVERYLRFASGLLSLGFGLFLAYEIAFVDGLITGDPAATPIQ